MGYDKDFRCRSGEKSFYTLSFTLEVTSLDMSSIYIAYDRPYNYSEDLQQFIRGIQGTKNARVETICRSLAGHECKMVTITDNIDLMMSYNELIKFYQSKESANKYFIKNAIAEMTERDLARK